MSIIELSALESLWATVAEACLTIALFPGLDLRLVVNQMYSTPLNNDLSRVSTAADALTRAGPQSGEGVRGRTRHRRRFQSHLYTRSRGDPEWTCACACMPRLTRPARFAPRQDCAPEDRGEPPRVQHPRRRRFHAAWPGVTFNRRRPIKNAPTAAAGSLIECFEGGLPATRRVTATVPKYPGRLDEPEPGQEAGADLALLAAYFAEHTGRRSVRPACARKSSESRSSQHSDTIYALTKGNFWDNNK